jgi:hypothetical protein
MRSYLALIVSITACALTLVSSSAQDQSAAMTVEISERDLGGVVKGPNGAEAGVWVIAETRELGTRFAKIAVTDDEGRFVIPDLPAANYHVWVRGYGLVDSPKVTSAPGHLLQLNAFIAPNRAAAAQYYPAIYWFSIIFPERGRMAMACRRSFKVWING